jgi:hypothetical protein
VGEHAVNIVKLRTCERFLRLNEFDAFGHTRLHTPPRKIKSFLDDLDVFLRYLNLAGCCFEVQINLSNFVLYFEFQIRRGETGPPRNRAGAGVLRASETMARRYRARLSPFAQICENIFVRTNLYKRMFPSVVYGLREPEIYKG